ATLEAAGYRVIRIANRDVTRDHLGALLSRALGDRASFPLSRRERGTGGEDQRTGEGDRGRGLSRGREMRGVKTREGIGGKGGWRRQQGEEVGGGDFDCSG